MLKHKELSRECAARGLQGSKLSKLVQRLMACALFWLVTDSFAETNQRTIITNVRIVTMTSPQVLENKVVVVSGDRIVALPDQREFAPRDVDTVIDGHAGFLVPGLIDTHIHIDHPQDLTMLPLYGVTSAINMRGLPWHLRQRQAIREEGRFAPDYLTSGDYLDGDPPNMLPMTSATGVDGARAAVDHMERAGFDFIKVYSELGREQYLAICERARQLGLRVAGHLPDTVSVDDVTQCPQVNVAHGEQLFKLLASRKDAMEISHVVSALSKADVTLTGNISLYIENGKQPADLQQLIERPEAELIHPATFQPFRPGFNRYARRDEAWVARIAEIVTDLRVISHMAQEIDPRFLVAGSDMPVAGAYPGVALIQEIMAYADSGLTPYEALSTATVNAGRLMKLLSPDFPVVGVVTPGARADLVLLKSSPLSGLDTLRNPSGVMLRGKWFNAGAMDDVRQKLVSSNRRLDGWVRELEAAIFSRDLDQAYSLFESYRQQQPDAVLFAQYPVFFYGFSFLYGEAGLTKDPESARKAVLLYDIYRQTYPEFHSAHHVYGLALEASGDVAAALAAQQRALEIWPGFSPARAALERLD